MKTGLMTIGLLVISNMFMTFAWYGNLKLKEIGISTCWPMWVVILLSWFIALFEYVFMVPANNMGSQINGGPFSLMQLKIIQEVISLSVFTVIAALVFNTETLHWNHAVSFLFLVGAVFFAFLK